MGKKKLCDGKSKDKAHYWVLDDKSLGICKKCGAQKQFPDVVSSWQNRKLVIGKASHGRPKHSRS